MSPQNALEYFSHVMRKPAFCICEKKGADQLRGNCTADQRLCFRYIDSALPLHPKFSASSHLLWLYSPVCVDLVENPKDRFSRDMAHLRMYFKISLPMLEQVNQSLHCLLCFCKLRRHYFTLKVIIFKF